MAQPLLFRWQRAVVNDPSTVAADKHVALTLAIHMNLDGENAHPSTRTLARECGRKPQTVITSVKRLEELSYLKVVRGVKRSSRGWSSDVNHYTAQMPLGTTAAGAHRGTRQLPQGAHKLHKSNGGSPDGSAAVQHLPLDDCGGCGQRLLLVDELYCAKCAKEKAA